MCVSFEFRRLCARRKHPVQRDCEFWVRRLHEHAAHTPTHTIMRTHATAKLLTPSTQNVSRASQGRKKEKSSLNPETFCTIEHWHRRTFAISSLFILCFTRRATQHRKTLTSKYKYRGFYYIKNLIPIRLPIFQWGTFRCCPQFLICNTSGMSVYSTYSLPAFRVMMFSLTEGLSVPQGSQQI